MLVLFLALSLVFAEGNESTNFKEKVASSKIIPNCDYKKGDETGIFTIDYKENNKHHQFYIMKGLDPETCFFHVNQIQGLKKKYSKLELRGHDKSFSPPSTVIWAWQSVRSENECHGYFKHDCN